MARKQEFKPSLFEKVRAMLLGLNQQVEDCEIVVDANVPIECERVRQDIEVLEEAMNTVNLICVVTNCDMEPILDTEEKAKVLDMPNDERIRKMRVPADLAVPLADIVARWYILYNDSCSGCRSMAFTRLVRMWPQGLAPSDEAVETMAAGEVKRNCVTCGQPRLAGSN